MSLWTWASAVWAKPGVEIACLDLQDRAGQSVVLLLWGVWSATCGRPIEPAFGNRAAALVRPIETDVLRPMRLARRALAQTKLGPDEQAQRDAYAQILAVELNLERAMLGALERLSSDETVEARADAIHSVLMLMEIWRGGPISDGDRALAAALIEALA